MKKILIIGSRRNGTKNDPQLIARQITSEDVEAGLAYWEDLVFDITTGKVKILYSDSDIITDKPDLVIALGWYKNGKDSIYRDIAYSVALALKHAGITFWNSEMGNQRSTTKLSMMVQLALENLDVPHTLFSLNFGAIESKHEYPFIAKAVAASRGKSNYLVESDSDLLDLKQLDGHFIIQDFLPNDHDLRVICFNGHPQLVLRRSRDPEADTHLNNTSQGGRATWLELGDVNKQLLTFVEKIAIITGREMAGIDLIPDAMSAFGYSCLEVNPVPQLTSGTDIDKKLASFHEAIRSL